jgi:integrase/recombinase XerD
MSSQSNSKLPAVHKANPALKLLDEKIVEGFLASYGNQKTKDAYAHCLGQFKVWISTLPAQYNGFNLIAEFRSFLQTKVDSPDPDQRISSYSAGLYMAAIKKYAKFLFRNGLLEHDPGENVKGFKRNKAHFRRALDRNTEVPRLLDVIDRTTDIGIRDYSMVMILLHTGIRGFELAAADYGDLDSVEGRPILWIRSKGKSGKSDMVLITERPYKALMAYLELRKGLNPQSPLFVTEQNGLRHRLSTRTIRERVDTYLKKAGLKTSRITLHSLRHTAAITGLKMGADIRSIQQMLRHSTPSTTMIYLNDISRLDKPAEDVINYDG